MNVEIGAEAAQFPEKEYINGIAVAVWAHSAYLELNREPCSAIFILDTYTVYNVTHCLSKSASAIPKYTSSRLFIQFTGRAFNGSFTKKAFNIGSNSNGLVFRPLREFFMKLHL